MKEPTEEQRKKLYTQCQLTMIHGLQKAGAKINPSFYDVQLMFSQEQLIQGLKDLGVEYDKIPRQTAWWQFWKDDVELRIKKGITLIK